MHSSIGTNAARLLQVQRKPCRSCHQSSCKRARLYGRFRATAQGPAGSPDEAGDPEVQDTLVKLVNLQVGAEQVKARAAEGSESLRQTAEEVSMVEDQAASGGQDFISFTKTL